MKMAIDFENKDGRETYLNEKLDDLLSGINSSYGQVLLNELVTRLQRTLKDFDEEIETIMGDLKNSSSRRNEIMHNLMEDVEATAATKNQKQEKSEEKDSAEMSEFEKKLEGI